MARVGITISSSAPTEPDVCALAPRTTMPSSLRSTIAQVHVGVVLLGRALAAVALDVGDRGRRHDLLALEAADVLDDALVVVRAVGLVDVDRRDHQRLQLVPADAGVAAQRGALGQELRRLEVLEQVVRARRHVPEDVALLAVQIRARRSSSRRSPDRTRPGRASCPTRSASARTRGDGRDPRTPRASGSRPSGPRAAWTAPRVCKAP